MFLIYTPPPTQSVAKEALVWDSRAKNMFLGDCYWEWRVDPRGLFGGFVSPPTITVLLPWDSLGSYPKKMDWMHGTGIFQQLFRKVPLIGGIGDILITQGRQGL